MWYHIQEYEIDRMIFTPDAKQRRYFTTVLQMPLDVGREVSLEKFDWLGAAYAITLKRKAFLK